MISKRFRITYNAPVVLTFCFAAAAVYLLSRFAFEDKLIPAFFTVPGHGNTADSFSFTCPLDYFRLLFHVLGHGSPAHLFGNLCYLLLLGPILEKKYGSLKIGIMMLITTLVSGFINALFIPYPMCGASDIIFMMILMISYTSIDKTELPLSFIMIFIIYIGKELFGEENPQIATFAHIAGGICGSLFAFIFTPEAEEKSRPVEIEEFEDKPEKSKKSRKTKTSEKNSKAEKTKIQKDTEKTDEKNDDDSTIVGTIEL